MKAGSERPPEQGGLDNILIIRDYWPQRQRRLNQDGRAAPHCALTMRTLGLVMMLNFYHGVCGTGLDVIGESTG
jgi:hypothetical protein